ncbi:MAG TPA: dockerin type I domain-containing protein, partial [Tepidisphaeraceae bacterium]|nr:dockerin type I domain-containing protein [Tepidisphaeraceae bacterium]
ARGISGVAVDLAGLDPLAVLTADDFDLAISRSATGPFAPAGVTPSVQVLRGQGFGGSDRVVLTFPDNAVRDTWLRVTVRPNARTRLTAPETFYYGHLTGETGDSAAGGALTVTAIDMLRTRRAVGGTYDTRYDFNRDGRVSPVDLAIVRAAQRRSLGLLNAPAPPAPTPPPPSASAGDAGENRDEEQGLLA